MREAEGMIRTWKMSVEEKAVIDNKHALLPRLVIHAGVIITRYENNPRRQDSVSEHQEQETTQQDAKVWREKVVWMMPNDNHRRNKLDSIHQFGVFVVIVPRTGELVVLFSEGAVAVRTVRRLSKDRKWNMEFMSKAKGCTVGRQGQRWRRHQWWWYFGESGRSSMRPTN